MTEVTIPLRSHDEAVQVLGPYDRNAKLLRKSLDIEIYTRKGNLRLKGADAVVFEAQRRVEHLLGKLRKGRELGSDQVEAILLGPDRSTTLSEPSGERAPRSSVDRAVPFVERRRAHAPGRALGFHARPVEPRGENQRRYLDAIEETALIFAIGAAGTGKTYLAVAGAVRALRAGRVKRLVITRPVVEAGERLGFLPGDLQAKLDPYMRPIYDALYDLVGFEDVARLEEAGVIEIAPLAYMRGRTLSHAVVILDEAQNATISQMKMFLTRMGQGATMIVTGDATQSDLDPDGRGGFKDAIQRLRGFSGVSVIEFARKDIVRHPLVESIVRAYEGPAPARGGDRSDPT